MDDQHEACNRTAKNSPKHRDAKTGIIIDVTVGLIALSHPLRPIVFFHNYCKIDTNY